MSHKAFARLSPAERLQRLAGRDAATKATIDARITAFKRKVKEEKIELEPIVPEAVGPGNRQSGAEVIDAEVQQLIDELFRLRMSPDVRSFRSPLFAGYDPALGVSPFAYQMHDDPCPQNRGEHLLALMRKYWMLVFGFKVSTQGTSKKDILVSGLAQIIFEADYKKITDLDVKLCLGDLKGKTLTQIAKDIHGRPANKETIKRLADRIKHKVKRWGQPQKQLRGHK